MFNLLFTGADSTQARDVMPRLSAMCHILAVDARFTSSLPMGVQSRIGDLRDESFVQSTLDGIDVVLHFAPLSLPFNTDGDNLDHAARGTYLLLKMALERNIGHVVLSSALGLFDAFPPNHDVQPNWCPRPNATVPDLCAWTSEFLARERARDAGARFACIRLPVKLTEADTRAIADVISSESSTGWRVMHVGERSPQPVSQSRSPSPQVASRPIHNIVIFGAGGPLASVTVRQLKQTYHLRLTDVQPLPDIVATRPPQSTGAPVPKLLDAPHEWRVVDVTDTDQVMSACEGMDAIINCTVIRHEVARAWRVNMLGAYNIMRAAVAHGIRRVVQTGPFQIGREGAAGYNWDTHVVDDVPPRPGGYWDLYLHSKLVGQEICRIFAKQHGLEVPTLLFNDFVDLDVSLPQPDNPFLISWEDAARAVRAALEVPSLPSPFEVLHINSDMPHGIFPNDKAKRVLDWQPKDDLRRFWSH